MDVVCGRCRAEYEFDDALISERGTTVRCTNCGLQFKVFPPVGLRAPEVWLVFHPRDRRVEPIRYESLRQMQKDIARGVVTADHLLARGEEKPRALRDIVELQPLLHQPKSEPPPPADSAPAHDVPAAPPGTKTVLGVPQRRDPSAHVGAPAPPRPPEDLVSDLDEHAIVPAQPSDPQIPVTKGKPREGKPRIRSALSMTPPTNQAKSNQPEDGDPEHDDGEGRGSIPPPRQSLRSTLAGSSGAQRISPVPEEASPPSPRGMAPPPGPEQNPSAFSAEMAPASERPSAAEKLAGKVAAPAPRAVPVQVTLPVDPKISDSGEYSGLMTPTPSGMRAYRSAEADPVSSMAGAPVKQGARTGVIVLAVLLGAMAFLGFANRDKLSAALSNSKPEKAEEPATPQEIPPDLALRLEMTDAAWISASLLQTPKSVFARPKAGDLSKLLAELSSHRASNSWKRVNLLRAAGRLAEARVTAGALDKGPEQSYALALLDLAEAKDDPPWPIVIERLREASSGERGRFLARSAFIYALAASGSLPRAAADFEAFGQIAGGKEAPLYGELKEYLERLGAFEKKAEDSSAQPGDAPKEAAALDAEAGPADASSAEEETAPDPASEEGDRPSKPKVSAAIKGKVDQADAMWRGGNQEGALVLYRQVVAEIGTKHFLGQRSAARIAQAERERASGK